MLDFIDAFKEKGLFLSSDLTAKKLSLRAEGLSFDTREPLKNAIFFCKGAHFKEKYLFDALASGALCYVSEKRHEGAEGFILVSDIRKAMVCAAELFYEHAADKLYTIGITGTKGKSTTAVYLKNIADAWLKSRGLPDAALISSVLSYDGRESEEPQLTTPEAIPLHRHFYNALSGGHKYFITEVSSQALKYDRVSGVSFRLACFTNIAPDHVGPGEHSSFEDYFSSKLKIFDNCETAVVNADSERFEEIKEYVKGKCELLSYGQSEKADIVYKFIGKKNGGSVFRVTASEGLILHEKRKISFDEELYISMPGLFNISNAAAAVSLALVLGIPKEFIKSGLASSTVTGRMKSFESRDGKIACIVDYAHNGLSFERVFESVKAEYEGRKIITVFGCPGNKAPERREAMGKSAGRHSDYVIVTEDDPAEESFSDIAERIVSQLSGCPFFVEEDRGKAIRKAFFGCTDEKRLILLLGKGEERFMRRGTRDVPCPSDADYALRYLKEYDS